MLPPLNMTNDGGSSPQLSPAQKRAQSLENRNSIDVLNKSPQLVEMDHLSEVKVQRMTGAQTVVE